MILEEIHVRNLLSHADSHLDFTTSPLWLIWGKNGSGKSALFDAVEYALYGEHRAGSRQNMRYLVKHGEPHATVCVVFRLLGERYRVHQFIDPKRGNHGQVERWDLRAGDWEKLNVGGEGSVAIWNWFKKRLPSHDLFRSAVYLRQSDTAHFFGRDANQRAQRFAELIDLSQYTLLSDRSSTYRKDAEKRRDDAKAKLDEQGDVSKEATNVLERQIQEAAAATEEAQRAVRYAEATHKGAIEWNRLLEERSGKEAERRTLFNLIRDRQIIEAANTQVRNWDSVAVQLALYWQRRSDAVKRHEEAEKVRQNAVGLERTLENKRVELEQLHGRQEELEIQVIPSTQAEFQRWQQQAEALNLEADIAAERARENTAVQEVGRLSGKDIELREWEARQIALSSLQRLADDNLAVCKAQDDLALAERSIATVQHDEARAQEACEQAKFILHNREETLSEAAKSVKLLKEEVARLEGQIEAHGQLEGGEAICPVCDQSLDDIAHEHVRQVLVAEHNRIETLKRDVEAAMNAQAIATQGRDEAKRTTQGRENAWNIAAQETRLAEQHLRAVRNALEQATKRLESSRRTVEQNHSAYATHIEEITPDWVQAQSALIRTELQKVKKAAEALAMAKSRQLDAQSKLDALRSRRVKDTEPFGDFHTVQGLRTRQDQLQENARECKTKLERLRNEERESREQVNRLSGDVQRFEEQIRAQHSAAEGAEDEARKLDNEADGIQLGLGTGLVGVLKDRKSYEAKQSVIEQMRPTADQLPRLLQAQGQLEQLDRDLARITSNLAQVSPDHQLLLGKAQEFEAEARNRFQTARDEMGRLENAQVNLEKRRQRADVYRDEMRIADVEVTDWGTLARLLKPGGDMQVWIMSREQQQIIREVNLVLQQLDDPLRVRLGDPLRQAGTELQDVVIVDTIDSTEGIRHFELLSGGEQFRVSLALALALHRRVAGGAAGTLIVDEGFGSLDSDWRDSLAQQMVDTTCGILSLQLAENVILCSHSSEVQRHFPNRWIVEKSGGKATVRRLSADDSHLDLDA